MKNFLEKLLLSVPACFFTFTVEQKEIVFGILFLFVIDTFLGIWASLRFKMFKSNSLQRAIGKFSKYFIAMINAWILSSVFPFAFGWVFGVVGAFIMVTEALSNIENLALLGFKVPTWIVSKINNQFKDLKNGKEAPETIMEERDNKCNN